MKFGFNNLYEKGDTVIFERNDQLLVGIITGYSADASAWNSIWYNIAINKNCILAYTTGGDISEGDIICKVSDKDVDNLVTSFIKGERE